MNIIPFITMKDHAACCRGLHCIAVSNGCGFSGFGAIYLLMIILGVSLIFLVVSSPAIEEITAYALESIGNLLSGKWASEAIICTMPWFISFLQHFNAELPNSPVML